MKEVISESYVIVKSRYVGYGIDLRIEEFYEDVREKDIPKLEKRVAELEKDAQEGESYFLENVWNFHAYYEE